MNRVEVKVIVANFVQERKDCSLYLEDFSSIYSITVLKRSKRWYGLFLTCNFLREPARKRWYNWMFPYLYTVTLMMVTVPYGTRLLNCHYVATYDWRKVIRPVYWKKLIIHMYVIYLLSLAWKGSVISVNMTFFWFYKLWIYCRRTLRKRCWNIYFFLLNIR